MDTNGLITYFAIVAAVVPFLSRTSRLRIQLRALQAAMIASPLLTALFYLVYFEYFALVCSLHNSAICNALAISDAEASNLAIVPALALLGYFLNLIFGRRFKPSEWNMLAQHIDRLHQDGETETAVEIIERQVISPNATLDMLDKRAESKQKRADKAATQDSYFLTAPILPHPIDHIISVVRRHERVAERLSISAPRVMERLIESKSVQARGLDDVYLSQLIRHTSSSIYSEKSFAEQAKVLADSCNSCPTWCFFL